MTYNEDYNFTFSDLYSLANRLDDNRVGDFQGKIADALDLQNQHPDYRQTAKFAVIENTIQAGQPEDITSLKEAYDRPGKGSGHIDTIVGKIVQRDVQSALGADFDLMEKFSNKERYPEIVAALLEVRSERIQTEFVASIERFLQGALRDIETVYRDQEKKNYTG